MTRPDTIRANTRAILAASTGRGFGRRWIVPGFSNAVQYVTAGRSAYSEDSAVVHFPARDVNGAEYRSGFVLSRFPRERVKTELAYLAGTPRPWLRICSGQNRKPGGPSWGICLDESGLAPWWRAESASGAVRNFRTPEQAARACERLESCLAPHRESLESLAAAVRSDRRDATRQAFADSLDHYTGVRP